MSMPFKDRFFEDFSPGEVIEFGDYLVTEEEILEFAKRYDPQPFHIDRKAAGESIFGGLIASGWHTGSAMMRLLADHFISSVAGLGSPGLDEVTWHKPTRPDAVMTVRVTVLDKRRSQSKPDRGLFSHKVEVFDPGGDVAMTVRGKGIVKLRHPGTP